MSEVTPRRLASSGIIMIFLNVLTNWEIDWLVCWELTKCHETLDTKRNRCLLSSCQRANNNNGDKMPSVVKQVYYRKHPENWKMERRVKKSTYEIWKWTKCKNVVKAVNWWKSEWSACFSSELNWFPEMFLFITIIIFS